MAQSTAGSKIHLVHSSLCAAMRTLPEPFTFIWRLTAYRACAVSPAKPLRLPGDGLDDGLVDSDLLAAYAEG